jgi:hypothetical protein
MAITHETENRRLVPTAWLTTDNSPLLASLIAALATLILVLMLPRAWVLPSLSILLVTVALGLGLLTRGGRSEPVSAGWYVSAALAYIGFGVALLSDPEHVLPLFESAKPAH